jgi:hypothetical protein
MPQHVVHDTVPVVVSVVSYDLAVEEPFLSYTWERAHGPGLIRLGRSAPHMEVIGGEPGATTTHPIGLRLGTWLVRENQRDDEIADIEKALADPDNAPHRDVLEMALEETDRSKTGERPTRIQIRAHDAVFEQKRPDWRIVGIHGCGDLTMNAWKVAYVDGSLTDHGPTLVVLEEERVKERRYSCLVKWKPFGGCGPRYSIEEMQFKKNAADTLDDTAWVHFGGTKIARASAIEFAVSGPQIVRDGKVVPAIASCEQFGDVRHLLLTPNLNPKEKLYPSERTTRPRRYFDTDWYDDVWLGEAYLFENGNNVLRAALSGPITMTTPTGLTDEQLRGALARNYRELHSTTEPLKAGEWRPRDVVDSFGNKHAGIEICFRRSTYTWGMLGLTRDGRKLMSFACEGRPGIGGYTLEAAAEKFASYGAWNALLVDEGFDVFQIADFDGQGLKPVLGPRRHRLRCVFIMAERKPQEPQP